MARHLYKGPHLIVIHIYNNPGAYPGFLKGGTNILFLKKSFVLNLHTFFWHWDWFSEYSNFFLEKIKFSILDIIKLNICIRFWFRGRVPGSWLPFATSKENTSSTKKQSHRIACFSRETSKKKSLWMNYSKLNSSLLKMFFCDYMRLLK